MKQKKIEEYHHRKYQKKQIKEHYHGYKKDKSITAPLKKYRDFSTVLLEKIRNVTKVTTDTNAT